MPVLTLMILILVFGASLMFLLYAFKNLKGIAFLFSLSTLCILLAVGNEILNDEINYPWIKQLSINFHLKVDHLSLLFLYVLSIIFPIAILAVNNSSVIYFGLILALQALLIIFFTAKDLAVFTVFWEATLLPLYFMITLFGSSERKRAALQFIIYMIAGSCLLVAAVLALYFANLSISGTSSFNLDTLQKISDTMPYAAFVLSVFLLAFAVKTPVFPFHAWLPQAYTEASTSGTIILSAVLSKTGIYGIIRIGMGLFPTALKLWSPYLLPLAIFSVLYGGYAAWRQKNYKKLLAYSSFSHVNLILAGLFVTAQVAHTGAYLQVINHAITITGLFLVAGYLEDRINSRSLKHYRGLAKELPLLCWITLVFVLSSVAIPGTNNFIGELLIFLGVFDFNPLLAAVLGLSIILSVIYMLRYMQINFFGTDETSDKQYHDIGIKEILILVPLIVLIFVIGLYPQNLLNQLELIR